MNALHAIFIRPVEQLLELLFVRFAAATGSYGWSLVLLSLAVTLITAPLYYVAERWKIREQILQKTMARDLASIRKHYSGQKRFYLVRNVHRLHGYKSFYALRTSLGLLIQIPFFFAAYGYLSQFRGYAGTGFLFVPDLGRPDDLLWGAALLPFVMTAVNVVSSLVYTRSRSLKDNAQLLLLALVFLVVLYDQPAGLLVYWTMNNVFAMLKNLLLARFLPQPGPAAAGEPAAAVSRRVLTAAELSPWYFVPVALLVAAQAFWQVHFDRSFKYCILATAIIGAALSFALILRQARVPRPRSARLRSMDLALLWALFGVSAYLLLFERRQNILLSNATVKFIPAVIQDIIVYVAGRRLLPGAPAEDAGLAPAQARRIFEAASVFLFAYVFVLSPMLVYFSSPQDIGIEVGPLLARLAPWAIGFSLASAGLIRLAGGGAQRRAAEASVALILVAITYSYVIPGDYGILDEFNLEKAFLLEHTPLGLFLVDVLVIILAAAASRYALRRWATVVVPCLGAVAIAFAVQVTVSAVRMDRAAIVAADRETPALPADSGAVNHFSKTGRNIVLVIADMFNGNYIGRMLEQFPETRDKLDGFTWYPNTLSISSHTATSLPGVLGGWNYSPEHMNAVPGTGMQKYEEAVAGFGTALLDRGYDVSMVDLLYMDAAKIGGGKYAGKLHVGRSDEYVGYWRGAAGGSVKRELAGGKARLLVMVTLFQSVPFMLKARVYDDGSWLVFRRSYQFDYIARKTTGNYAYLDLLPKVSTAAGPGDTFKFIHTQFTHEPFGITREGRIIDREFPDPQSRSFIDGTSAYYTARKFIDFLAAWTLWMKREGIYDNTFIVVVSDHSNNAMDNDLRLPDAAAGLVRRHDISRAGALLLVKRFGGSGPLRRDDRLMSNADTPAIVLNAAGDRSVYGEDPTEGPAPRGRVVEYGSLRDNWHDFLNSERAKFNEYLVRDNIYVPANWEIK